jgi:protein-S-isoprenylcysteine O-methyltransferase Ste14
LARFGASRFLTRRNLRDLIIVLSLASAMLFTIGKMTMCTGFAVLTLGCFLHVVSKGVLIRDVVLCNKGIYQVVRHPYYLANYLIDTSFCLLSGNVFLVFLYPFLFFWAYGPTIRKEEQLLFAGHGDSFTKDSMEIPQVFPDVVSARNAKTLFAGFSARRITLKECARIMKFIATGSLFILIQQVKAGAFNMVGGVLLPTGRNDSELWFAIITLTLYFGSFVVLWLAKQGKNGSRQSSKA